MALFCNQCGTQSNDGAGFCDNCGATLRRPTSPGPSVDPTTTAPTTVPYHGNDGAESVARLKAFAGSKSRVYAIAALVGVLVLGGGTAYFMLTPPAATSARLLASAKEGYGPSLGAQSRRDLCLTNMNYSGGNINVAENDQGTQDWMKALVTAGLYAAAVPVSSGGYFPQTLLQYTPLPELAKWRDGPRICVAKEVAIVDVTDIEKPHEETLGNGNEGKKMLLVKGTLILQADNVAPWLDKAEVRDLVLGHMEGWGYQDSKLQKKVPDTFGLRDGKWTSGPGFRADMQRQFRSSPKFGEAQNAPAGASTQGLFAGLGSKLSGLFSFGHPLKGQWRVDTEGMGRALGMTLPGGLGLDAKITFTSDAMEVAGQSVKCSFEVDGNQIKVTPQGNAASLVFVMDGKDTASLDMGLVKVQYKRVD